MTTIVLLLLGSGFALLAFQGWRLRAGSDPSTSVEGFARVLAAIDPDAKRPVVMTASAETSSQDAAQVDHAG